MSTRRFTVHVNGHAGHRGNVLAFAFLDRVRAILDAFGHAERNYLDVPFRQTDYEIVDVAKTNPTELVLTPVSSNKNYDPFNTIDWTISQLEKIAKGEPVDEKVDEQLATRFARIVPLEHQTGATAIWITRGATKIVFDKEFKMHSEAVAKLRKATSHLPKWTENKAQGAVTGELLQVDDWEGKAEFAIKPPIGAERITCKFPESLREKVQQTLFKNARFHGLLHYSADSPFPYLVEISDIELMEETPDADRLVLLRGLFDGQEVNNGGVGEAFNDL